VSARRWWPPRPRRDRGRRETGQKSRTTRSGVAYYKSITSPGAPLDVGTVITVTALAEEAIVWVSYVSPLPLAVLLLTGMYLFALPYVTRRRAARRA
jgi:hypothetical protein